jgi:hypothetical protein
LTDPHEYEELGALGSSRRYNESGSVTGDKSDIMVQASIQVESLAEASVVYNHKVGGRYVFRNEMLSRLNNPTNAKRIAKLSDLGISGNQALQTAFNNAVPIMNELIKISVRLRQ